MGVVVLYSAFKFHYHYYYYRLETGLARIIQILNLWLRFYVVYCRQVRLIWPQVWSWKSQKP